jgi:hypothetical protein
MTAYGNNPNVPRLAARLREWEAVRDTLVAEDRKNWSTRAWMGKRSYSKDLWARVDAALRKRLARLPGVPKRPR